MANAVLRQSQVLSAAAWDRVRDLRNGFHRGEAMDRSMASSASLTAAAVTNTRIAQGQRVPLLSHSLSKQISAQKPRSVQCTSWGQASACGKPEVRRRTWRCRTSDSVCSPRATVPDPGWRDSAEYGNKALVVNGFRQLGRLATCLHPLSAGSSTSRGLSLAFTSRGGSC